MRALALFLALGGMGCAATASALPLCDDKVTDGLASPSMERNAHRLTPPPESIVYAFDTRKAFGFSYRYVVDEQGLVSCVTPGSKYDDTAFDMTPQRQSYFDSMVDWRFTPFVVDGSAKPVFFEGYKNEEERPPYHVMPPEGDVSQAVITVGWQPHLIQPPGFDMTIKGDGTVVYDGGFGSFWGRQTYHIDRPRLMP